VLHAPELHPDVKFLLGPDPMNRGCRSPNPNAKAASVACQQQTASGLTMPEADSDEFNVANRPSTLWNEIEVATTEEDDRFPADGDAVDWLRDDAVDWLRKAPRPAAAQCWTTCLLPGHALAAAHSMGGQQTCHPVHTQHKVCVTESVPPAVGAGSRQCDAPRMLAGAAT
jgi:hypothetical protein